MDTPEELHSIPHTPPDEVAVTPPPASAGSPDAEPQLERCDGDWAPYIGIHYRVRREQDRTD